MKFSIGIPTTLALASLSLANQIYVSNSLDLMSSMKNAVAGDTILVAPGTYIGDQTLSGDPGNLPNGTGYFWIGNNGTADHPIVVAAADPNQMPLLQGSSISSGYVIHITGEHVVLKALKVTLGDKGVIFDNASFGILEDCEIFNVASELVHVRDSSSQVILSRNKVYSSGNGGNGSIGEGFYIGTDKARWGADDVPQTGWGEEAIAEGYGGYDWRVHNTQVLCNYLSGGISAECMDIKEGTQGTIVKDNIFVGDSIGLKAGAESYDDSFIDLKGVSATITGNTFYGATNNISKYVAEVRRSFPHVPASLTADGYSDPWCDIGDADQNQCNASENTVSTTKPVDQRSGCAEVFDLDWSRLQNPPSSILYKSSSSITIKSIGQYDMLGRQSK